MGQSAFHGSIDDEGHSITMRSSFTIRAAGFRRDGFHGSAALFQLVGDGLDSLRGISVEIPQEESVRSFRVDDENRAVADSLFDLPS